jgi:hypothetical protein
VGKQILLESNVDTKKFPASMISNTISRLKDKNILPDTLRRRNEKMVRVGVIYYYLQTYPFLILSIGRMKFDARQFGVHCALWQYYP